MNLSDTGQARVNGYLFVLERSLKTFLPGDVCRDAVREIETHIRERVAAAGGAPNERDALEKILTELGPPLRVAQAYSAERVIDEAVATGRFAAIVRAVWHLGMTTMRGFFVGFGLINLYLLGCGFMLIAALKPFFPANVGLFMTGRAWPPFTFGAQFPAPSEPRGGFWIVPICLIIGLAILRVSHRGAIRYLNWWRAKRG